MLLATATPINRREAFGADALRTLLLRLATTYFDPTLHVGRPPGGARLGAPQIVAEMLPEPLHTPVMARVRSLVDAALAAAPAERKSPVVPSKP